MSHYEPQLFDGQEEPSVLELLKGVQHALNTVRNTKLRGSPLALRDTYQLAAIVDAVVKQMEAERA